MIINQQFEILSMNKFQSTVLFLKQLQFFFGTLRVDYNQSVF